MARPTKLTPEVQDRIIQAVTAGNYLETAAQYAGIDGSTLRRWVAKGESDTSAEPYRSFCTALKSARAAAEVRSVALIQQAATGGTWQAAAWYLERSYPDRWGRTRVEVTGPSDGSSQPIRVEISAEELEAKIQALAAKDAKRQEKG
jgi:transposase-like protein